MLEDVLRTLKLALEARIKAKVPTAHPIMHWLIEYTASMINRCHISGEDSKTAYERMHGTPCKDKLPEFGETVYFFVPKKNEANLMHAGVWVSSLDVVGILIPNS